MKKLIYLMFLSPLFALSQAKSAPVNPNKTYHVCLDITLNDANALINGLSQSDVIAARLSTYFSQSLSLQINQSITQEAEIQRKADSLSKPIQPQQAPNPPIKPNNKGTGK